ncbi:CU044_2847 family protein [Leptolyngbya sp. FACHB-261]|uniref:CU044_2847 family protein n=1 Tax=Leptolyngbya sp. FACHB-261 TaxID=2692806 RepID=UPI0016876EEF|nr:CU044_2847 family protein [Leptolyngbya sp. FACHB-261]MBD2101496.1 hypothetical protein [Leptolyngbya sp. FACHB-261]
MSEVQRLLYTDEDGKEYEIFIESKTTSELPELEAPEDERGSREIRTDAVVKMRQARDMIRGYASYALGAFKDFGTAQVEEVTLKFGLKIGGKAGIPFITEGTAESNLEIEVKCKFPDKNGLT